MRWLDGITDSRDMGLIGPGSGLPRRSPVRKACGAEFSSWGREDSCGLVLDHPLQGQPVRAPLKSRASSLILICSRLLNRTKPATACKLVSKDDSILER